MKHAGTPVAIRDVSKRFNQTLAVDHVSLDIAGGELFFLLGPSGCGKTTLLRMLAGFVEPDNGSVHFGIKDITRLPPRERDAGMVFQSYALWPHMSVAKNVAYGLKVRGLTQADANQRVNQALKMVRMEGFGDRRPNELSGGQQQRVALARALVIEPRVVLLDEPLSNLDTRLRDEMREEIRRLHQETGLTMIYVTHDQKEALSLAGRLAVMRDGRIVQVGTPAEVYSRPANGFIAGFLGDVNLIPGRVLQVKGDQVQVQTAIGTLTGVASSNAIVPDKNVQCAIRPTYLQPSAGRSAINSMPVRVEHTAFLGDLLQVRVVAGDGTRLSVAALPSASPMFHPGSEVMLSARPDEVMVFPGDVDR
ncbi:MAG: ABC transporter ATP-binding protein [Gemmataceae bacterium]